MTNEPEPVSGPPDFPVRPPSAPHPAAAVHEPPPIAATEPPQRPGSAWLVPTDPPLV